jgi:hypothetical protein
MNGMLIRCFSPKWTAQPHCRLQDVQTYRCPTNTSHRTRFCSCKTCPKVLQRNNSPPFFLSCVLAFRSCHVCCHTTMTNCNCCPIRYPNLYEVRLIPTKRDIAFVEYFDEGSATTAKDALHNYKLDGENKIKVCKCQSTLMHLSVNNAGFCTDYIRTEVRRGSRLYFVQLCTTAYLPVFLCT